MDADRDRVEAALLDAVRTRDAYLTEIASHLIVAGGKRLRPVMTVAAAQVGGQSPVSDEVILGGISCELVHLGSLYHDDVMDESPERRGVETVNAKWGNLQAILAGDFLLSRASEIAASLGTEVAGLLARTIGWLCEGQIEGSVHMGLGYALTEDFPSDPETGFPTFSTLRQLGIIRAKDVPPIEVRLIESPQPNAPYGIKGVGEIGLVPTAGAVAAALHSCDGRWRTSLPMKDAAGEED